MIAAFDLTVLAAPEPAAQTGVAEAEAELEPESVVDPEASTAIVDEVAPDADVLESEEDQDARERAMSYSEMASVAPTPATSETPTATTQTPTATTQTPTATTQTTSDADVRTVLDNGIREIAGEVRNSLDFHRSQEGGGEVSLVVLSGSALDLPGFADALQDQLGVQVRARVGAPGRARARWRLGASPGGRRRPGRRARCPNEGRQPDPGRRSAAAPASVPGRSEWRRVRRARPARRARDLRAALRQRAPSDLEPPRRRSRRSPPRRSRPRRGRPARALHQLHGAARTARAGGRPSSSTRALTGRTPSTNSVACCPSATHSPRCRARSARAAARPRPPPTRPRPRAPPPPPRPANAAGRERLERVLDDPAGSVPTFTLAGCATSQTEVAQTLDRLRLIDGVSEVTLQSSTQGG